MVGVCADGSGDRVLLCAALASVGRADKPVATGAVSRRLILVLGVVAALVMIPLGFLSGVVAGFVALAALVSALLYDWPLKSTPISVVPYAV